MIYHSGTWEYTRSDGSRGVVPVWMPSEGGVLGRPWPLTQTERVNLGAPEPTLEDVTAFPAAAQATEAAAVVAPQVKRYIQASTAARWLGSSDEAQEAEESEESGTCSSDTHTRSWSAEYPALTKLGGALCRKMPDDSEENEDDDLPPLENVTSA